MARVVIRFDLSGLNIESVQKATFEINKYKTNLGAVGVDGNYDYTIYKITKPWDTYATWFKASSSSNWNSKGGDFSMPALDTFHYKKGVNGWQRYDVTSAVNEFLKDPQSNHGFILAAYGGNDTQSDPSRNQNSLYHSSEYSTMISNRPKLTLVTDPSGLKNKPALNSGPQANIKTVCSKIACFLSDPGKKEITVSNYSGRIIFKSSTAVSNVWYEIPISLGKGAYVVSVKRAHAMRISKITIVD